MTRGIYRITRVETWHSYVGRSFDIEDRFRAHRSGLENGKHHCQHLQRAWDRYGGDAFEFEVLVEMPSAAKDELIAREEHYINGMGYYNVGRAQGGYDIRTHPDRENILKKMAESSAAFLATTTAKQRRELFANPKFGERNGMFGRTTSDLQKKRAREVNLGRAIEPWHRDLIGDLKRKSYVVELTDGTREVVAGGTALAEYLGVTINHARYLIISGKKAERGSQLGAKIVEIVPVKT